VVRRRIAKAIDALAADPRPRGCKSLQGLPDLLRDIDHRKDIYR
jgi:hypothetical protein